MKFNIPTTQSQTNFLSTIAQFHSTWEYRLASIAVVLQFFIGSATILWFWKHLPPTIPMWYSRPWGEDRLASPWFLWLPLAVAALIYSINLLIASQLNVHHPMFVRVLFLTTFLVSCLSVFQIISIISLVG